MALRYLHDNSTRRSALVSEHVSTDLKVIFKDQCVFSVTKTKVIININSRVGRRTTSSENNHFCDTWKDEDSFHNK